jgi:group I intron endonuclease
MIVYALINKSSGKIYVGQTTKGLSVRWHQHVKSSRKKTVKQVIHKAILKYGPEAFDVVVLETATEKRELDELERYYIALADSMLPRGYNQKPGGSTATVSVEVRDRMSLAAKARWATFRAEGRRLPDEHREKLRVNLAKAREVLRAA